MPMYHAYEVRRVGGSVLEVEVPRSSIYFHMGLPKTGTTFLQKQVFPRLAGLVHVNTSVPDGVFTHSDQLSAFLISNENMFSGPFVTRSGSWLGDFRMGVRSLGTIAPDAGTIIGFRSHTTLLRSLYGQHLRDGGTRRLDASFFDLDSDSGLLQVRDLLFLDRIRMLREAFQRDPFVYFQEELRLNPERLVADLAQFMGLPRPSAGSWQLGVVNPGLRHYQAKVLRRMNQISRIIPLTNVVTRKLRLTPYTVCQRYLGGLPGPSIKLGYLQASRIKSRYRADLEAALEYLARTRGESIAEELSAVV